MSKHTIVALVLMVVFVIVLLLTGGEVDIKFFAWTIDNVQVSFALLGSMVVGVIIGILLK
ncbi:MAG: hypothetical protein R6X19_04805 [Kiritimatiellia bacterium]